MIVNAFLKGIPVGLILEFSFCPAFFLVIQTALEKGFKKAIVTSIGVSSSDAVFICLSLLGITAIEGLLKDVFGVIASIVLIIYGVVMIFSKPEILKKRNPKVKDIRSKNEYIKLYFKGFLLNIANPFVLIFWVSIAGIVSQTAPKDQFLLYNIFFFLGILFTVFSMDVIKSLTAHKLKNYLRPRYIIYANRIIGCIIVILGVLLIFKTFMIN